MNKALKEFELAKQKRDAFNNEKQLRKEEELSKIRNMQSSMDDFCQMFTKELQVHLPPTVGVIGPVTRSLTGQRHDDPPNFAWVVKCEGFKDDEISANMQSATEIRLFGGLTNHRIVVYCTKTDVGWIFSQTSYESRAMPGKLPEGVIELNGISEAADNLLADVFCSMAKEATKK